ncbi:hypothetical protein JXA84_02635 [candidate division WOR-3 bacterium]|nr:hypothetical protein [candidate division WOR-3 bacterium]
MKRTLCLLTAVPLFFAAFCSKNTQARADTSASDSSVEATVPEEQMSPGKLGDSIGIVYLKAIEDVTLMIEGKPNPGQIRPDVEELKEKYIQILVSLGNLREAFDESDRKLVDQAIVLKLNSLANVDWYETYTQCLQSYTSDHDFYDLLLSFNIIGQYANYDLLKKQEPEEALRLGIE